MLPLCPKLFFWGTTFRSLLNNSSLFLLRKSQSQSTEPIWTRWSEVKGRRDCDLWHRFVEHVCEAAMFESSELLYSNCHVYTSSLICVDTELRVMGDHVTKLSIRHDIYYITQHSYACNLEPHQRAEVFHHEAVIAVLLASWRLFTVCLNILRVDYAHIQMCSKYNDVATFSWDLI